MSSNKKAYNAETILQNKIFKRRRIIIERKRKGYLFSKRKTKISSVIKEVIFAPEDFRFIDNPELCLNFFNSLRSKDKCSIVEGKRKFRISLSRVKEIDFATISILKCIFEEAKFYGISFEGTYPRNEDCKKSLLESGFLNRVSEDEAKEIQIKSKGNYFSLEKKQGKLTLKDFENFENISIDAYEYVSGKEGFSDEIITMLKEIGGNAIEWSNSYNQQWQIGVYKDNGKVIFNVTDLGRGILDTLYVSQKLKLVDLFFFRDNLEILNRAFERKYGSLSQEINRNRGLPSIKKIFEDNKISNLLVCTNDVYLNFQLPSKSHMFKRGNFKFYGTFYQWEYDQNCI
ncbi:hypothetical protein [Adhaeribacter radiodurans]|uniref:Uncharacterized protein n=1 Tax=Adhaeribacter radiodurans TaxID=2745197 RepID=A0A7L7L7R5_9BACT|nr:hypothetical protein [Adhaeribacter radiodurans]QMU28838.1 hypothetical protein HUW48_12675 [Adhaeribacter radiodurans]